MSKIQNAFKNKTAFIGFITAGDPCFDSTVEFVKEMAKAGADLIELGIPFSDPIADGSVIQAANLRAFESGTNTDTVFEMVKEIRKDTDIPLVFLTYLNPVFKYGYENFFSKCFEVGVDGLVIPDLPFEEKEEANTIAKKYDVDIISMIAPTSKNRIDKIAKDSSGFLYVVSSMGVTGVRSEFNTDLDEIISCVKKVSDTPCAIGFGISNKEQAKQMSQYGDGVIVGSAIVKIIEKYGKNATPYLVEFTKEIKEAISYSQT